MYTVYVCPTNYIAKASKHPNDIIVHAHALIHKYNVQYIVNTCTWKLYEVMHVLQHNYVHVCLCTKDLCV